MPDHAGSGQLAGRRRAALPDRGFPVTVAAVDRLLAVGAEWHFRHRPTLGTVRFVHLLGCGTVKAPFLKRFLIGKTRIVVRHRSYLVCAGDYGIFE